jgi:hypothetical protein
MALTPVEQYRSRVRSKDTASKGTGTRVWIVQSRSTAAAEDAMMTTAGTMIYPDDPTLVFDRFDYSPLGTANATQVVGSYSTNGAGRFTQRPTKTPDEWYVWGWDQRTATVETYIAVQSTVSASSGSASETVAVWKVEKVPVGETRILRPLKARITVINTLDLDPIAVQRDRIHTIRGYDYRYTGAEVSQVDQNTFDVKHNWEQDKGTPVPVTAVNVMSPPDALNGLIRNPYSLVRVLPPDNPRVAGGYPGDPISIYPYARDPEGWRSLPGVPLNL